MLKELAWDVHPISILQMYQEFLDCFYMDAEDFDEKFNKYSSSIIIKGENILIPDIKSRKFLANKIINHFKEISK